MTTHDNGPTPEGFIAPAGRHCGLLCVDLACPVCGEWIRQPNAVLGEN